MPDAREPASPGWFWAWPTRHGEQPAGAPANAPLLLLLLGVDGTSAGVAVHYWMPTAGRWPTRERLFERRWVEPAMDKRECIRLALRAIRELAAEAGIE